MFVAYDTKNQLTRVLVLVLYSQLFHKMYPQEQLFPEAVVSENTEDDKASIDWISALEDDTDLNFWPAWVFV